MTESHRLPIHPEISQCRLCAVHLPHPSPRNRFWQSRNPWFIEQVLPVLRRQVQRALRD